jgi:hypothetical protein
MLQRWLIIIAQGIHSFDEWQTEASKVLNTENVILRCCSSSDM